MVLIQKNYLNDDGISDELTEARLKAIKAIKAKKGKKPMMNLKKK